MTAGDTAGPSRNHPQTAKPLPSVGIFWNVPEGDRTVLVTDRTVLAEAELYGDGLTHPRGHHEVWEAWRRLGGHCAAPPRPAAGDRASRV